MKGEIYNALASLNRSFDVVLESLHVLREEGLLTLEYVQKRTEMVEELRSGLNTMILNELHRRETEDRQHYAKMRLTTEARLKTINGKTN
ncbi:MAG TPA: hypothetical protein VI685_00765 [Candidatus Angelobacter sp.]